MGEELAKILVSVPTLDRLTEPRTRYRSRRQLAVYDVPLRGAPKGASRHGIAYVHIFATGIMKQLCASKKRLRGLFRDAQDAECTVLRVLSIRHISVLGDARGGWRDWRDEKLDRRRGMLRRLTFG